MARGVYHVQVQEEKKLQSQDVPDRKKKIRESIISKRNSSIMGLPNNSTKQQVGYAFLGPALVSFLIYFIDVTITGGLVFFHAKNGNWELMVATLGCVFLPSLVFFIYTLSQSKYWNDNQMSTSDQIKWAGYRFLQLIAGPFWVVRRYTKKIFWSYTALTSKDFDSREEALEKLILPSQVELYIFLQAFFQAAPQAFLQTYFVIYQYHNDLTSGPVEVASFFSSLLVLSLTTEYFQRFESQRILGRTEPWRKRPPVEEDINPEIPLPEEIIEASAPPPDDPDLIESCSSDDEYERPVALPKPEEPPPLPRPPRPKSIQEVIAWQKRINNEPEDEVDSNDKTLPLPKRRVRIEGLEEDHLVGKFVSFIFWYAFLIGRFLSVILFAIFYPQYVGIVIGIHYIIMIISLLKKPQCSDIYSVMTTLSLGIVFLFAPIEYKTKFKNAKYFYIYYMILIFIETTSMNLVWYFFEEYSDWWYNFLLIVTFVSFGLSIITLVHYYTMLKPQKVFFYAK